MNIKQYQKNPTSFFSALKSRQELNEKFGSQLYQFEKFDKSQSCCAYALFLCFTSSELKDDPNNEEYARAFFNLVFNEKIQASSKNYFHETTVYLKRAFKHLIAAEKYEKLFQDLNFESIAYTKSREDIEILARPFIDSSKDIKLTLITHCMIAMIISDIYEIPMFRNLKILCDSLKISTNDRWAIISLIMKIGALKLKDVNELSEKDKLFIYIAMVKDLYENDGQIDAVELQTIDRIEQYLKIDSSFSIDAKNYIARSFAMASHIEKRNIDKKDAEIIIYLAMQVIGLDGVQDEGEIRMLKKILGIFDNDDDIGSITKNVPEDADLTAVKKEDQLYGLLTVLQMILADDEIQKEEMEYLYAQLKKLMKGGKILSNDTDLLCLLEIIFSNPKWVEKYIHFFTTFRQLYTNHLQKKHVIVRIVAAYYFLTRQKKAERIGEDFVTILSRIFDLTIEDNKTIKALVGLKVYEEGFTVDEEMYLLISFVFIMKSITHNFDINPEDSNILMGGIIRDVNKYVPLTRYHKDTYKFLFGWI